MSRPCDGDTGDGQAWCVAHNRELVECVAEVTGQRDRAFMLLRSLRPLTTMDMRARVDKVLMEVRASDNDGSDRKGI